MANGIPPGIYPPPQAPRAFGLPPQASAPASWGVDTSDPWTGIYVVGGGAIATAALVALLAYVSKQEHDELRAEVGGVDSRLLDYQQAHAIEHRELAAMQDRLFGSLQAQVDELRPMARPAAYALPATVYEEPTYASSAMPATVYSPGASYAPNTVYSVRPSGHSFDGFSRMSTLPMPAYLPSYPPTLPAGMGPISALTESLSMRHSAAPPSSGSAPTRAVSPSFRSAPTAVPSSGMRKTNVLPSHVDDMVTRVMSRRG